MVKCFWSEVTDGNWLMHSRHEYGGRVRAGVSAKLSHGNAVADGMAENTSSGGLPFTIAAVNRRNGSDEP